MIKEIKFRNIFTMPDEWTREVSGINLYRGRSIKFTEGINVLSGPSGSGRSTIIRNIAKYYHCYETGLSEVTNSSSKELINDRNEFKNGLHIVSDGCVSYIDKELLNNNFNEFLNKFYNFNFKENITNIASEEYKLETNKMAIKYLELGYKNISKNWDFKPTILIDKIDTHMDALNSIYFIKELVEQVTNHFQIIIATNNQLIYKFDSINFIDLEKGYTNKVKSELDNLSF